MLAHKIIEKIGKLNFKVYTTSRQKKSKKLNHIKFDINKDDLELINKASFDYIINCAGIIKPYIDENSNNSVLNALKVNSVFPRELSNKFRRSKIIQIATDCVYSGLKGNYDEKSFHDALDIYGKSKSLGEINSSNFMNLRCSIIGKEIRNNKSLISWFLNNEENISLNGFTNHIWNGVTTDVFAKICIGIIQNKYFFSGTHHLVPADKVTKYKLLLLLKKKFKKKYEINKFSTFVKCDRSLSTVNLRRNNKIWRLSGYKNPPTIFDMIDEL